MIFPIWSNTNFEKHYILPGTGQDRIFLKTGDPPPVPFTKLEEFITLGYCGKVRNPPFIHGFQGIKG